MPDEDVVPSNEEEDDFKTDLKVPAEDPGAVADGASDEVPVENVEIVPEHPIAAVSTQGKMVEASDAFEARKQAAVAKRIDSKK